jgi:short-subunit dehydrogenase
VAPIPGTVVITGASSGIGQALALRYARAGATIGLIGRDQTRLQNVAAECQRRGANVRSGEIDVRDRPELTRWLEAFDTATPIDLLIANAGVMEGTPPGGKIEPPDAAYALIQTNVLGTLNTVQPLLPKMMARGRGQIAIVSSIAGFIPLPDSPSYCASKAAVLNYGLALRALLHPYGIGVSVICPGYVTTPMMLRESGPKPFTVPPERAADLICRGLDRNQAVIAFQFFFALVTRIGGLLPDRLRQWTMRPFRFTVSEPD